VPGEHLDQVVAVTEAMADAPRNPGKEAEVEDAARIREEERRLAEQGLRCYTVAARCDRTGELAGLTCLCVDPLDPSWGLQEITAVTRTHRGHRLGLLVKVAMLELLAAHEPQLTQIVSLTAEGNEHMAAINTELGFEILERQLSWELETARIPRPADPGLPEAGAAQS
jgi:hypothetical protein